jgi:DNA gyrase subunit A
VPDVRVFKGRDSTGVRGIMLAKDDRAISMAILRHVEASVDERAAYLRLAAAARRAVSDETNGEAGEEVSQDADGEEATRAIELGQERYAHLGAAEQFILTVSANGYGKRSSAYEYRVTGRGGKGIVAMAVTSRNGPLVASFPVEHSDQIMLVTNGGQLIRCPVDGIRIAGRATQGVIVFDTARDERVVSVERITEEAAAEEDEAQG